MMLDAMIAENKDRRSRSNDRVLISFESLEMGDVDEQSAGKTRFTRG